MKADTDNSRSECSLQNARRSEGNANASPRYARLLASARAAEARRRELVRFMESRRNRLQFEEVLKLVG
jgi:hypothetical protein